MLINIIFFAVFGFTMWWYIRMILYYWKCSEPKATKLKWVWIFFVVLATKKAKTVIKSNRSELLCCYCSVDDFEDFNFCCYYILPPIPFYVTQNMPLSFLEQPLLYNLLLLYEGPDLWPSAHWYANIRFKMYSFVVLTHKHSKHPFAYSPPSFKLFDTN